MQCESCVVVDSEAVKECNGNNVCQDCRDNIKDSMILHVCDECQIEVDAEFCVLHPNAPIASYLIG